MKGRINVKKTLLTLGICILGFTLVGCGQIPTLKDGKEVVASIKGKKISAEDLYEKLKTQSGTVTLTNMIDEFIANKEVETDEDAKTYAESQIESYKSSYKSYGQDWGLLLLPSLLRRSLRRLRASRGERSGQRRRCRRWGYAWTYRSACR